MSSVPPPFPPASFPHAHGPNGPTVDFGPFLTHTAPQPARPARSTAAAALFNLTGLGVGFAYLGRRLAAVVCLAVTAVLVALAFLTDAADLPVLWIALAVLWLGAMALVAALLARRHPRPLTPRGRALPVVWAALLVVALVGGFVGYRIAGASVYADGQAAQARADCTIAVERFDTVDGPFELTLSSDEPASRVGRAQCQAYLVATDAEGRGDYATAVRGYQDYRRDFPGTVLVGFAAENLENTYNAWARQLRAAGDHPGAIRVYRELLTQNDPAFDSPQARADLAETYLEQAEQLRNAATTGDGNQRAGRARSAIDALLVVAGEFADTPRAASVPQAIADSSTAANGLFAAGQYCEGLPVLDSFVSLPGDGPTAGIVGVAHSNRAVAMFECGLAGYRGSTYTGAIEQLNAFLGAYPNDPQAAQARLRP